MNEFERAEVRALANVLENWPTADEPGGGHPEANEWLSVERAGRVLGIGVHTVYGLINRGELVAYRIGRVYRIRREDIAAFLESARVKPGDLHHLAPDAVSSSR